MRTGLLAAVARFCSVRRSTALMRAMSSRWLKGLVT
jgi:hypothetical protein